MSHPLRIASMAVKETIGAVERSSSGKREAAAFWLGSPTALTVETIVIPTGRGVIFEPFSISLSLEWMNLLGEFCDSTSTVVLGAVHCHPARAFYSEIDRDGFFHSPEVVSVVLPNYAKTELAEAATEWGIYIGLPWGLWRPSTWEMAVTLDETLEFGLRVLELE